MSRPLISICIATTNRAGFLKECLNSITAQFANQKIRENVNVFVLDSQSTDNTKIVVSEFVNKFDNLKYIEDTEKRNLHIITAAGLANGEYIWVFSDDDLHAQNSLESAISFINNNPVDLVFCNLLGFHENGKKYKNLLKVKDDIIMNGRKQWFELLNKKFYINIDYYTMFCSNWIIKKELFDKNFFIFEKFNDSLDLFPMPSLILYTKTEFSFGVISKQIVLNRGDNESWADKNKIKHFFYRDKLWRDCYQKIIKNNKEILPKYFITKVCIKNVLRFKELIKIILILILKKIGLYNKHLSK